jgi:hypothetical protein
MSIAEVWIGSVKGEGREGAELREGRHRKKKCSDTVRAYAVRACAPSGDFFT